MRGRNHVPNPEPRKPAAEDERRPAGLLDRIEEIEARRSAASEGASKEDGAPKGPESGGDKKAKRELDLDDVW